MITAQQIKEIEDQAAEKGITKLALMENAGKEVYRVLNERFDLKDKKMLIVCYHGNNGGDGFVAARYLCEVCEVDVLFLGDESRLKKEALINYKKIEDNEMVQFLMIDDVNFDDYDIIIDAILGTGASGALDEDILNAIRCINSSKAYKVAIDVPTGINPDSGEAYETHVNADLIITFHDLKTGLEKYKDKTVVVDIGIR